MIKRHISASVIILIAGIFMWSCQSPAGPDNQNPGTYENTIQVVIYSDPWHADIWVNGSPTGKRTHHWVDLKPGTHEIMLLKPAYEVWKTTITLKAEDIIGGSTSVHANLFGIRITVENPASDTIWIKGEDALITWDPPYISPVKESSDNKIVTVDAGTPYLPRVTIYLFEGSTEVMTIVHDVENTGSYSWTVDPSLEDGTDYQVRVLSSWETPRIAVIYGESEPFTIQ